MPNKYSEEVKALRQAMLNEIEGAQFYKISADKFGNSATKDIFLHLAEEEEKHYNYLKSLSEKLMEIKDEDLGFDTKSLEEEIPSPQIYNWEKADPSLLNIAVSVFGIAMNMEKDSVAFYEKAREKAESEEAKKLFDILIKWEGVHLEQFTNQYNIYQQEWWQQQNFEPF